MEILPFTYMFMEFYEPDGEVFDEDCEEDGTWEPIAGFNNEGDVEEFFRVFEASEGYEPKLCKWNDKGQYNEIGLEDI